jgi:hypothetical protein
MLISKSLIQIDKKGSFDEDIQEKLEARLVFDVVLDLLCDRVGCPAIGAGLVGGASL